MTYNGWFAIKPDQTKPVIVGGVCKINKGTEKHINKIL